MNKYDLHSVRSSAGVIKTRWIDNTLEVNFADSFEGDTAVKSAKFKLIINVTKGFRSNREVSKITVYKRQLVERDFLQGWKETPSDNILEQTILYRIGRNISIDNKLKKLEKLRRQQSGSDF